MISLALAQTTGSPSTLDLAGQMVPFIIILVIMYFLILRPQQRKTQKHREMIKNLRRGDSVILTSGLMGKITRLIEEAEVEVEIAPNVRVRCLRHAISEVHAKGEPVKADPETKE